MAVLAIIALGPAHADPDRAARLPLAEQVDELRHSPWPLHPTCADASAPSPACSRSATKRPWMSWIAIDPYPTAAATRLTEPCRTSPAAKTRGMLVSSSNGRRSSGHPGSP